MIVARAPVNNSEVDHELIEKQEHQWRKIRRRVGITQINPSNCFRRVEKLVLPSVFDTSLSSLIHDVKLAEIGRAHV